jgi:5-methylcytosine-specific restriction endonuclease McrA
VPRPNGRLTLSERLVILERDNYLCKVCGRGGKKSDWILEVDHINGKPHDHTPENLQTICVACHNDKHPWRWKDPYHCVLTFTQRRKHTSV